MEWAWLRIHRALTTLDMSLIHLYPAMNYTKMLQRYFRRAERRRLNAVRAPETIQRLIASQTNWPDVQDRSTIYTLFQGTLVRRHAQVVRGATSKATAVWRFLAQLVWTAVIVSGLAGTAGLSPTASWRGRRPLVRSADRWVAAAASDPRFSGVACDRTGLCVPVWVLVKLRRRLRQGDRGTHERVAAV